MAADQGNVYLVDASKHHPGPISGYPDPKNALRRKKSVEGVDIDRVDLAMLRPEQSATPSHATRNPQQQPSKPARPAAPSPTRQQSAAISPQPAVATARSPPRSAAPSPARIDPPAIRQRRARSPSSDPQPRQPATDRRTGPVRFRPLLPRQGTHANPATAAPLPLPPPGSAGVAKRNRRTRHDRSRHTAAHARNDTVEAAGHLLARVASADVAGLGPSGEGILCP